MSADIFNVIDARFNMRELVMLIQALAADGSQQGRDRADLLRKLRQLHAEAVPA